MRLKLVTAPTLEPLTIEDVREAPELRISVTDDDPRLGQYIISARRTFELFTGRILMESTWDLYLNKFPCKSYVELPPPLQTVTGVSYYDSAGVLQPTWPAANYIVDAVSEPGRLALASGCSWPMTYDRVNAVIVRFTSGYHRQADVEEPIRDGLLLFIQQQYDGIDRREAYEDKWWWFRTAVPV